MNFFTAPAAISNVYIIFSYEETTTGICATHAALHDKPEFCLPAVIAGDEIS
jgi:hypothetical protein